ncbi:MAG: PDZ domain-containing protein [Acidobacteria bacterium]|nr:PDZ domain-containing protein [Acidobacteriota bacterium]
MAIRGPLGAPRAPAARVWVPLAASAFLAYFLLLLFCDFRRPFLGAVLALDDGVVVRGVSPGSAADAAGLREGDRINSVQGRRLEGRLDWLAAELMFPLGRPVPLGIDRMGAPVDAALVLEPAGADYWLRPEALMLAGVRGVQAVTLAAALLVWWRRSSDLVGRLGGWLLAATAVFTVVPPYRLAAVWGELPLPLGLLLWGPHLSVVAIGAVLFSFFAVFPRRWLRRPSHWVLAWTPMGLTLGWYVRFVFDMFYRPGFHLDGSALAAVLLPVTAGYILAGLTLLVCGYRTVEGELERRRTRVVVASSMAALLVGLPVVIGYWARPRGELSHSLFASPLFAVGTIWMLIFPLGFTYAILASSPVRRTRDYPPGHSVRARPSGALLGPAPGGARARSRRGDSSERAPERDPRAARVAVRGTHCAGGRGAAAAWRLAGSPRPALLPRKIQRAPFAQKCGCRHPPRRRLRGGVL